MKDLDIKGKTYGKWLVIGDKFYENGKAFAECQCGCGFIKNVLISNLKDSKSTQCKSCASLKNGLSESKTYNSWIAMKQRCTYIEDKNYQKYGAIGITVCEEWLYNFDNFLIDMGERPEGTTLNRINGAKLYSKETCEWATLSIQSYDTKKRKDNTSGRTGVHQVKGKWCSSIRYKRKLYHLGTFSTKEEAISARKEAEILYYSFNKA